MPSYTSLLVLALAASVVTPVLSSEEAQPHGKNEERAWKPLAKLAQWEPKYPKTYLAASTALFAGFTALAIYSGIEDHKQSRDVSRREERSFGRGMPVDISVGRLEDRSFSDIIRRTSSHLELLNRADLGEALSLFGRMLDELD